MELDIKININDNLVIFNNFEVVKNKIEEFLTKYENLIVSEEGIALATKDRALLNKIVKTMNDKRIEIEKQFKEQFEPFKNQVNSLIEPIKTVSENIDKQIKVFEEEQKKNKFNIIKNYFNSVVGDLKDILDFNLIYTDKWMNKGFSIENVQEIIQHILRHIIRDFEILNQDAKSVQLKDFYLNNKFDLSETLQEKKRIEEKEIKIKELEEKKRIEEEEKKQAKMLELAEDFNNKSIEEKYNNNNTIKTTIEENVITQEQQKIEEKQYKCTFEVIDTMEKLTLLKSFLINNNINYKRI